MAHIRRGSDPLLAEERRRRILSLLQEKGSVTVRELTSLFGVSEMTVHRDLKRLEREGVLRKAFGGAIAVADQEPAAPARTDGERWQPAAPEASCALCGKDPQANTRFVLLLAGARHATACCPHCGLILLRRLGAEVTTALATDFLTLRTIDAGAAAYLVGADAEPCCHPSTLAFASREDAERFRAGFGGEIASFAEAFHGTARA